MQKHISILICLCLVSIILFNGCETAEDIGEIPSIKFLDFRTGLINNDSSIYPYGELEFEFTDGNADFGVYEDVASDTTLPDSLRYNLFLIPLSKKDDNSYEFAEPDGDTVKICIYYDDKLNREGQYKIINGTITYRNLYITLPVYSLDTFAFKFFIMDRALNKSTPDTTFDLCYKHLE